MFYFQWPYLNYILLVRSAYFSNKPAPSSGASLPLPSNIKQTKKDQEKPSMKRKLMDGASNQISKKLVF